jgi:hypothetical protein
MRFVAHAAAANGFMDRLIEPPTRTEWLLLAITDALGLIGIYTGVLGVAWFVLTPTVCCWTVHFAYNALRRPQPAAG